MAELHRSEHQQEQSRPQNAASGEDDEEATLGLPASESKSVPARMSAAEDTLR